MYKKNFFVLSVREEVGYAVSSKHRNNLCECIFSSLNQLDSYVS